MSLNIKELRKSKGLTQGDLAKELHVSVKTITNWEKGSVTIPETKMVMLRDFFEEKGNISQATDLDTDQPDLITALMNHKVTGSPIPDQTIDQIADELNSVPKLKAERAALYKALNRDE